MSGFYRKDGSDDVWIRASNKEVDEAKMVGGIQWAWTAGFEYVTEVDVNGPNYEIVS